MMRTKTNVTLFHDNYNGGDVEEIDGKMRISSKNPNR